MAVVDDGDTVTIPAILDGGPGDGQEHAANATAIQLRVTMADRSRHLYERVHAEQVLPDGRRAVIFRWRGPC